MPMTGNTFSQIDKFIKRAVKYGYINKRRCIAEVIRTKDSKLWSKVTAQNHCLNDLLPPQKTHAHFGREVTTTFYYKSDLNAVSVAS